MVAVLRVSGHAMALTPGKGFPVDLLQTHAVSLWLVKPADKYKVSPARAGGDSQLELTNTLDVLELVAHALELLSTAV